MDARLASLDELLPVGAGPAELAEFQPCARYFAPLDCMIYLREDLPYRADRVDEFLTLLWHPQENRAIGVKIKGFRQIFATLRTVVAASGNDWLSDDQFPPLMKALEFAMTVRAGSLMTEKAEEVRLEDQKRLSDTYARAFEVIGGATFDPMQLGAAAR